MSSPARGGDSDKADASVPMPTVRELAQSLGVSDLQLLSVVDGVAEHLLKPPRPESPTAIRPGSRTVIGPADQAVILAEFYRRYPTATMNATAVDASNLGVTQIVQQATVAPINDGERTTANLMREDAVRAEAQPVDSTTHEYLPDATNGNDVSRDKIKLEADRVAAASDATEASLAATEPETARANADSQGKFNLVESAPIATAAGESDRTPAARSTLQPPISAVSSAGTSMSGSVQSAHAAELEYDTIVDASNVARYDSKKNKELTGKTTKLLAMRDALLAEGRRPLFVCDANLRWKVDDQPLFDSFDTWPDFQTVPPREEADWWILSAARERNAILISNDQFTKYAAEFGDLLKRVRRFMFIGSKLTIRPLDFQASVGN